MEGFGKQGEKEERKLDKGEIKDLKKMLDKLSRETNERVKNEYGLNDLLNHDAAIDPGKYLGVDEITEQTIKKDEGTVREEELINYGALNKDVQEFFAKEYGADTPDKIIAKRKEIQMNSGAGLAEVAVTMLLSQKLGKDFLVVRTALYDDYRNGVDNLIVDLESGKVVGAFDEVHESGAGKRTMDKGEKVRRAASRGGAKIRYGLELDKINGKLVRKSLEGVPLFYLGITKNELRRLVRELNKGDKGQTDEIYNTLLDSLATQCVNLDYYTHSPALKEQINSFSKLISKLKNTGEQKVV